MKRILSIFLLTVFLLGPVGFYTTYKVALYINYVQIRLSISRHKEFKNLTYLRISGEEEKQLRWNSSHKEFEFRGHMYDVAGYKNLPNGKLYCCYHDVKENNLKTALEKRRSAGDRQFKHLSKVFNSIFLVPQNLSGNSPDGAIFDYSAYVKSAILVAVDINSPPPKAAFFI